MKRVLGTLLSLDFQITSEDDLKGIPGIGKGTLARIKEILETGKLSELDKYDARSYGKIRGIENLLKVIGVGDRLARKLVIEDGITTVEKLKNAVKRGKIRVSSQVKLGLKYYGVAQRDIPRKEIQQIEAYLKSKAKSVDPNLGILICGSYRRGRLVSGDIDVMVYHPDVRYVRQIYQPEQYGLKSYLELFVALLTDDEFLLDTMSMSKMKYMGFCRYRNNPVRRIDIRMMPYNSLPSAMLYFTGPQELNEEMRQRAKKMDMLLNEYGLFIVDSQGNRIAVPVHSEKDIFEELGMRYLTPKERDVYSSHA